MSLRVAQPVGSIAALENVHVIATSQARPPTGRGGISEYTSFFHTLLPDPYHSFGDFN